MSSAAHSPLGEREDGSRVFSRRWLLIPAAFLAVIGLGYWAGTSLMVVGSLPNSGLRIDPRSLDLGTIWAQSDFERKLLVKNETSRNLEIIQFTSSCSCTSVFPESLSIPTGETRAISLKIDVTTPPQSQPSEPLTESTIDIAAILKGTPVPANWRLHAKIEHPVILSSGAIEFTAGELNTLQSEFPSKSLDVVCAQGIKRIFTTFDEKRAIVDFELASQSEGNIRYIITVTPSRTLPLGPFRFEIPILAEPIDGNTIVATYLPVRGIVVDDVEFMPNPANFGVGHIGEILRLSVVARSRSDTPFVLNVSTTRPNGVTIESTPPESTPREATTSHVLHLQQEVQRTGNHLSRLTFMVETNAHHTPVNIALTYHGLDSRPSSVHTYPPPPVKEDVANPR